VRECDYFVDASGHCRVKTYIDGLSQVHQVEFVYSTTRLRRGDNLESIEGITNYGDIFLLRWMEHWALFYVDQNQVIYLTAGHVDNFSFTKELQVARGLREIDLDIQMEAEADGTT
jgi:hypothetical protein